MRMLLPWGLIVAFGAQANEDAVTFYVGRITSVPAWHDIVSNPAHVDFEDAYVLVAARSRVLDRYYGERLSLEVEGQVAYNFGDQSHGEFNLAVGPRWHSFPWNDVVKTSVAFGAGLSMASEVPETEIELEGESAKLLVYWGIELTLGRPRSPWALSLRLHHRSSGFGLLADAGGMNALALGVRYAF